MIIGHWALGMGHGALGIGHGAWGIGHWAWGRRGGGAEGQRRKNLYKNSPLLPCSSAPHLPTLPTLPHLPHLPHPPCPIPHAQ